VDHLVRASPFGQLYPGIRPVALVPHELEGLEHRLIVLALVLQDHVVDEAAFQQRILTFEVGRLERPKRRFADGVDVDVGVFQVEQVQRGTFLTRMERGVVNVVEPPGSRGFCRKLAQGATILRSRLSETVLSSHRVLCLVSSNCRTRSYFATPLYVSMREW